MTFLNVRSLKTTLVLVLLTLGLQACYATALPLSRWDTIVGEGYVRPAFAQQMEMLRPTIVAAAQHHNPRGSGLSDKEFAELLATLLYNEHNGWFEDLVPPVRRVTPMYQWAQRELNVRFGADYSIWPSNLRPSVAEEIVEQRLPVPGGNIRVALTVPGAEAALASRDQQARYAALSAELAQPELAVEYLAANVARGVARCRYEGVPVTWQALAAWHNQGIVRSEQIAANALARSYVLRAAQYRALARELVAGNATTAR